MGSLSPACHATSLATLLIASQALALYNEGNEDWIGFEKLELRGLERLTGLTSLALRYHLVSEIRSARARTYTVCRLRFGNAPLELRLKRRVNTLKGSPTERAPANTSSCAISAHCRDCNCRRCRLERIPPVLASLTRLAALDLALNGLGEDVEDKASVLAPLSALSALEELHLEGALRMAVDSLPVSSTRLKVSLALVCSAANPLPCPKSKAGTRAWQAVPSLALSTCLSIFFRTPRTED